MIGACIFMTANETRDLTWMGSQIQNNFKFIVHSKCICDLTHVVELKWIANNEHNECFMS